MKLLIKWPSSTATTIKPKPPAPTRPKQITKTTARATIRITTIRQTTTAKATTKTTITIRMLLQQSVVAVMLQIRIIMIRTQKVMISRTITITVVKMAVRMAVRAVKITTTTMVNMINTIRKTTIKQTLEPAQAQTRQGIMRTSMRSMFRVRIRGRTQLKPKT